MRLYFVTRYGVKTYAYRNGPDGTVTGGSKMSPSEIPLDSEGAWAADAFEGEAKTRPLLPRFWHFGEPRLSFMNRCLAVDGFSRIFDGHLTSTTRRDSPGRFLRIITEVLLAPW